MGASSKLDPTERRRRVVLSSLLILSTIGGAALNAAYENGGHWRTVDFVRVSGIMALALVLALRATTAIRLTPRNPVLDDELTRANRASAAAWGFWALMVTLLAAFIGSFYEPITFTRVAPAFIVFGAAAAAMRFVFLERRGARMPAE